MLLNRVKGKRGLVSKLNRPYQRNQYREVETFRCTLVTHDKKNSLSKVQHIAVTTDIWTSISNDAYLSFTASYIDSDWTMKTPVLATVPMHERHTQTVIVAHLGDVAKDWNVSEKIVACIHDGAVNVKDAGACNSWTDIHCAAHKLQLCITTSMGTDKVSNHPISVCVCSSQTCWSLCPQSYGGR